MLKVNNKKAIRRLSARSLKNSKTRNIIAVVAIILTTVLFTSVFSVGMSAIDSMQQATMRQVGTSAHGGFKFLTWQQYEKLLEDPKIKDISYNIIIGFAENEALNKTYTEIRYTEEKSAKWGFCEPTTGTLPVKKMDVATSTKVLDALGLPHELGVQVPLQFTANGKKYTAKATLKREKFPTRNYDGINFSGGVYDALIVELGTGSGDNWWCVAFPPLCFVPEETSENFRYRSLIVELIRKFKEEQ